MKDFLLKLLNKKVLLSVMSVLLVCMLTGSTVLTTLYCADYSIEESVDEETDEESGEETEEETTDEGTDSTAGSDTSTDDEETEEFTDADADSDPDNTSTPEIDSSTETDSDGSEQASGEEDSGTIESGSEEDNSSGTTGEIENAVEIATPSEEENDSSDGEDNSEAETPDEDPTEDDEDADQTDDEVEANVNGWWYTSTYYSSFTISKSSTNYISKAGQLGYLAYMVNTKKNSYDGYTFALSADIDLSGHYWVGIGDTTTHFKGNFNGYGYKISGLTTYSSYSYAGLFGYCEAGSNSRTIQNIVFTSDCTFSGTGFVGSVAGYIDGRYTIYRCFNYGTVKSSSTGSSSNYYVGGIVGEIMCHLSSKSNYAWMYQCCNYGSVSGYSYVGGLLGAGLNNIRVNYSFNTGSVTGTGWSVGGIIGWICTHSSSMFWRYDCQVWVYNCYNTGNVKGGYYVAGIIGQNSLYNGDDNTLLVNCYSTGNVTTTTLSYAAGIVCAGSTSCMYIYGCYYSCTSYKYGIYYNGAQTDSTGVTIYQSNLSSNMKTQSWYSSNYRTTWFKYTIEVYPSWDFSSTWLITSDLNSSYPVLQWTVCKMNYYNSSTLLETKYYYIYNDFTLRKQSDQTTTITLTYSDSTNSSKSSSESKSITTKKFKNWNTSSGGTGTSYTGGNSAYFARGSKTLKSGSTSCSFSYSTTYAVVNLYAQWTSGDSSATFTIKTPYSNQMSSTADYSTYRFIGYNEYSSSSSSSSANAWLYSGQSYTISSSKTIYAKYSSASNYWRYYVDSSSSLSSSGGYYLITSAEDLALMAFLVNTSTTWAARSYKLTKDISLSSHFWTPIGLNNTFTGIFDGQGYTISGLKMYSYSPYDPNYWGGSSNNNLYMGLFARCSGTVQNVVIKTAAVTNAIYVGYGSSTYYHQHNTTYIGGAVAYSTGTVSKVGVLSNYSVSNSSYSSSSNKTIYDYYMGNVNNNYTYAGGLVGYKYGGTVDQCFSSAVIYEYTSQGYKRYGGLIGFAYFTGSTGTKVSNSFSNYYIRSYSTTDVYDGGLIGDAYTYGASGNITISNCYTNGTVAGSATYVGGFAGYANGYSSSKKLLINNCFSVFTANSVSTSGATRSFGGYYSSYVTLTGCYYNSSTTDTKISSSTGTDYFKSASSSQLSGWSITSDPSSITDSKTWICGQSYLNNSYPMLTWCLTAVDASSGWGTSSDKRDGSFATSMTATFSNTNILNNSTSYSVSSSTWSSTHDSSLSFVVMTGVSVSLSYGASTSLVADGWYEGSTRKSTSSSYSLGTLTTYTAKNYSNDITIVFSGYKITGVYFYLMNSSGGYTTTSAADYASAVVGGTTASANSSNYSITMDFDSSSIVVTPVAGYAVAGIGFARSSTSTYYVTSGSSGYNCDGTSSTQSRTSILDNTNSKSSCSYVTSTDSYDSTINGLNLGTVTRTFNSSYPFLMSNYYYSTSIYKCAPVLRIYIIKEVYELTYNVTDVSSNTSQVVRRVTLSGSTQTTLKNVSTNNTETTQDVYGVVGSATTHYFGVYWSMTGAKSLTFEDVITGLKSSMVSANSNYARYALSDIITSNTSGPTFSFTLTATAISYTLNSIAYTAGSESTTGGTVSNTPSVKITDTFALSSKFNVKANTNYYLYYVRPYKTYSTSYNYSGFYSSSNQNLNYVTGSSTLGSGVIYTIVANYCANNISTIASSPSTSHSGNDYLKLIFDFEIGHYKLQIQNTTGSKISVTGYWDGSSTGTNLSISNGSTSSAQTVTLASSANQKIDTGSTVVNIHCDSDYLRAYMVTSYDFYDSYAVKTTWRTSGYYYYQDQQEKASGSATYLTQTLILSKPTTASHSYSSGTAATLKNGVYEISSASNLQWLAYQVSQGKLLTSKFVQTCDIDLKSIDWSPIGTSTYAFAGTYDGGGYRILGLSVKTTVSGLSIEESGLGLFGYTNGATIENLTIQKGSVSGFSNVGAFVGYAVNTTLKNLNNCGCTISSNYGSVKIYSNWLSSTSNTTTTVSGSNYAGVVGYADSCTITACSNNGGTISVSYGSNAGGLVGTSTGTTISECYSSNVGKILYASIDSVSNISNCYWYSGSTVNYRYANTSGTQTTTATAPTTSNCKNYSTYWTTIGGTTVLKAFYW